MGPEANGERRPVARAKKGDIIWPPVKESRDTAGHPLSE